MNEPLGPKGRHWPSLEVLFARLVPADELGPGAVGTGAVEYLALGLEGPLAHLTPVYADGLELFDRHARTVHGGPLTEISEAAIDTLLQEAADGEVGGEAGFGFLMLARGHALEGMFGDPRHGGNRDYAGWRLIGYPGPRMRLTPELQEIGGADGEIRSVADFDLFGVSHR